MYKKILAKCTHSQLTTQQKQFTKKLRATLESVKHQFDHAFLYCDIFGSNMSNHQTMYLENFLTNNPKLKEKNIIFSNWNVLISKVDLVKILIQAQQTFGNKFVDEFCELYSAPNKIFHNIKSLILAIPNISPYYIGIDLFSWHNICAARLIINPEDILYPAFFSISQYENIYLSSVGECSVESDTPSEPV